MAKESKAKQAKDDGVNNDGFVAGQSLTPEQVLKYKAEQRKKGVLPAYTTIKPSRARKPKKRSKIHANAVDK